MSKNHFLIALLPNSKMIFTNSKAKIKNKYQKLLQKLIYHKISAGFNDFQQNLASFETADVL